MSSPVVLITGALTGIGRAAAVIFAQEGAHIVVSGRRDKQGQELVAELQGLGAEAIFVRTDVRKDEDVRNLVDQTVKRFGRLDIAVNNGGTEGLRGLVTEQTAESYADTFDTNVLGVLLSMKHELRAMLPQGSGSIVNVSSAYGSVGAAGASVYVASKHAVEGMTKSAALEVAGTGVRVNVVAPGTTDTGLLTRFTNTDENKAALVSTVPAKRLATPEEIAHVIAFVASANASYMTGASIPVDGGMIADQFQGRLDRAKCGEDQHAIQLEWRKIPMANVVKKYSISYELAQKMVDAAVVKARELGVSENVAILDDGGNLKAFGRMDGAPIPTTEMAQNKAYTALFGVSTQEFFNFIQGDPSLLAGIPTLARMAAWGGGFPIKVNGEVVGAIGVSGAPAVQNDVDCARAALRPLPDAVPTK